MKKINWKILNLSFWIEMLLAYFLPFEVKDNFSYQVGFPMPFLSIYDTKLGISPVASMHLNPIGLLVDGVIIYLIITVCMKGYQELMESGFGGRFYGNVFSGNQGNKNG